MFLGEGRLVHRPQVEETLPDFLKVGNDLIVSSVPFKERNRLPRLQSKCWDKKVASEKQAKEREFHRRLEMAESLVDDCGLKKRVYLVLGTGIYRLITNMGRLNSHHFATHVL